MTQKRSKASVGDRTVRPACWPPDSYQSSSSPYPPAPNLSGLAEVGAQWLPVSRRPQGPSGWLREEEDKPQERSRTDLRDPPFPSTPEEALTLDNRQHSMGPVQGDGQAQRPQVPLLLEQVVQFLLPGRGRKEDRATGLGLGLKAEPLGGWPRSQQTRPEHSRVVPCQCSKPQFPRVTNQGDANTPYPEGREMLTHGRRRHTGGTHREAGGDPQTYLTTCSSRLASSSACSVSVTS